MSNKFYQFLEAIADDKNMELIESVKRGYNAIHEAQLLRFPSHDDETENNVISAGDGSGDPTDQFEQILVHTGARFMELPNKFPNERATAVINAYKQGKMPFPQMIEWVAASYLKYSNAKNGRDRMTSVQQINDTFNWMMERITDLLVQCDCDQALDLIEVYADKKITLSELFDEISTALESDDSALVEGAEDELNYSDDSDEDYEIDEEDEDIGFKPSKKSTANSWEDDEEID